MALENVYITAATRTAVGKAGRGSLVGNRPDDMAAAVLISACERSGISPDQVQDVTMGCAMPEQEQGVNVARIAAIAAGMPDTTSGVTVNRFCSSGLEAMATVAAKLNAGMYDVAIAGGTESMSMVQMPGAKVSPNPRLSKEKPEIYIGMGNAGDNVAKDFNITREEIDAFALASNQKAAAAVAEGKFRDEITPLDLPGGGKFDTDEGPRADATIEALSSLRLAFAASPKLGFHTAGNSSQMSDGASAIVMMNEAGLKSTGAKPIAKFLSYNVAADSPKYLGPAQLVAIPKAIEMAGLTLDDIDLFEINEAFASVAILVTRELGLDPEKVNVNGGAIALGHPMGCTGAKLSTQIIHELKRRGKKYGVVTMCIGGGMGAAGVIEVLD
ncbi:MAG TPA: thiolase family protein [Candidatus Hydrogenedentes bacterium]|nr:thiolase family protein [Candidatus Hydrogenedentota bacterium]